MEQPMLSRRPGAPTLATIPEILDPIAGYLYVLDPVNQIAHRVPVQSRPMPVPPANIMLPAGYTRESEPLGTQIMSGVMLTGTTTPAGSRMGNDQPITNVAEIWTDPLTNVAC